MLKFECKGVVFQAIKDQQLPSHWEAAGWDQKRISPSALQQAQIIILNPPSFPPTSLQPRNHAEARSNFLFVHNDGSFPFLGLRGEGAATRRLGKVAGPVYHVLAKKTVEGKRA